MTYPELQNLIQTARSGNSDSAVELALLYQEDYAHILLTEIVRQFHLLLFKTLAVQLSQGYRHLLDTESQIAQTVNNYKDDPSLRSLNTTLETLIAAARRNGEEMLTKISIVISRSFQTLAKEYESLLNRIMPEYSNEVMSTTEVQAFLQRPTFKTFVENVKQLNSHFKLYNDKKRSESLLLYAVAKGNRHAVRLLSENYDIPTIEIIPRRRMNNSLLGQSHDIVTVWDKARESHSLPF